MSIDFYIESHPIESHGHFGTSIAEQYPEDQRILSLSPLILDAANVSEVECACHIATELPFR